jgi:thiopeptide-type bacteriocin biosynthesis protein
MSVSHGNDPHAPGSSWRQVFIHFDDYAAAERIGVGHLSPEMIRTEATGLITSWFFMRKNPCWRLRFLPAHGSEADATATVHHRLDRLREAGHIIKWVETIYEPETYAFGGTEAMALAHHLFHSDSTHILAHLGADSAPTSEPRSDQRRELSILLCCNLMRGADQDWYEQGDVWTRVAETRPKPPDATADRRNNLEAHLRRLLTVDTHPTSPLYHENENLAFLSDWTACFTETGQRLSDLARNGTLTRGTRAVLAHHIIFHWNRLGLSYQAQSLLANTASAVVFGRDGK